MAREPEDFITVEEAARRLRIGRTRAYVESGGAEGIIPAIPVGRLYRVPVARLEEIAGGPMRAFHRTDPATPITTEDARREPRRPRARLDDTDAVRHLNRHR